MFNDNMKWHIILIIDLSVLLLYLPQVILPCEMFGLIFLFVSSLLTHHLFLIT
jgi:hypothetical protein